MIIRWSGELVRWSCNLLPPLGVDWGTLKEPSVARLPLEPWSPGARLLLGLVRLRSLKLADLARPALLLAPRGEGARYWPGVRVRVR